MTVDIGRGAARLIRVISFNSFLCQVSFAMLAKRGVGNGGQGFVDDLGMVGRVQVCNSHYHQGVMDAADWGTAEAESAHSAAQLPFTFLHPSFASLLFSAFWLRMDVLEYQTKKGKRKKHFEWSKVSNFLLMI